MNNPAVNALPDRVRMADRVFLDVKERILKGELRRGSKLPTEKALAQDYAVSISTIREAIRGLSVIGLVQVRQGSGAYVSVNDDTLMAMSLGSIMRLQGVAARDAFGLFHIFIEHAAASVISQGSNTDIRRLREAAERFDPSDDAERNNINARAFHHALVSAAHNPLLASLSAYLAEVQMAFTTEAIRVMPDLWLDAVKGIQAIRMKFVEAVEARNLKAANAQAKAFSAHASAALEKLQRAISANPQLPPIEELMANAVASVERN